MTTKVSLCPIHPVPNTERGIEGASLDIKSLICSLEARNIIKNGCPLMMNHPSQHLKLG